MKQILAILILCILQYACQRREIDYEYEGNVEVSVVPEWCDDVIEAEMPKYLKACFYPVNGGKMHERYIDPEGETVKIPSGEYNIVVYTWRINANAQTVQFRNQEHFDTFEAYTAETLRSENRKHTTPILLQPDNYMHSWSSSDAPVSIKKTGIQSSDFSKRENLCVVINPRMQNQVKRYSVRIQIMNIKSIASIEAHVTGSTGQFRLAHGSVSSDHYAIKIEPYLAATKNDDAIVDLSFNTFGMHLNSTRNSENAVGPVNLVITTVNGDNLTQKSVIDLTENIIAIENGEKDEIDHKELPPVVVEPSAPPESGGGGFNPPEIGDWEDGGSSDLVF